MACRLAAAGVTVTWQLEASGPLEASVQLAVGVNASPRAEETRVTAPVGADFVPAASVSVTTTVTRLPCPTTTGLVPKLTDVAVVRVWTDSSGEPPPEVCTALPG